MWVQNKHALYFFSQHNIPFQNMSNKNSLVNTGHWCLVGKYDSQEPVLVIYISSGTSTINLIDVTSPTSVSILVKWYDPRSGGGLQIGSVSSLQLGQGPQSLGNAPNSGDKDWIVLLSGSA